MTDPVPLIEIDNLYMRYGHNEVLKGVGLKVMPHEVVCVIGASGSGKSTLLRCINALEEIQAGTVRLMGDVVSGPGVDRNRLRRSVGMVFQSFNLFPHMTVLQNITLAPVRVAKRPKREAESEARQLLARFGLGDKADVVPDQLSGGQQQRVAIIRALAMRPEVLLLDEITSSLDPELVGEVLDIVRELAQQGMTMLLATHEMSFAKEVASTVSFLDQGVLVETGSPDKIFHHAESERTQAFLRRVSLAERG